MGDARHLEMLLKPLSFPSSSPSNRCPVHLPCTSVSKFKVFCSSSGLDKPDQRGSEDISKPPKRSSRGRTRQTLGLNEIKCSVLEPAQKVITEPCDSPEDTAGALGASKREVNAESVAKQVKEQIKKQQKNKASDATAEEIKQLREWVKKNTPKAETADQPIPHNPNAERMRNRIQALINADLERRYNSDNENSDDEPDPLFVDEEDPYWLDEPDDGWGYKVSDLFKEDFGVQERKKKVNEEDEDVTDIKDWDLEPEKWAAKDVDAMNWTDTVLSDPSPLVALLYDRYGKKGRECYHVLRELEDAANQIWNSKRLPPRLVKINVSFEEDLAAALKVKEVPTLLFIKGGKLLHQQSGYHTADNLLRMISYFYYGAARPACLKKILPPQTVSKAK